MKTKLITLLSAAALSCFNLSAMAQGRQIAFPGAEGFGRYTSGGRGGKVYHVTTLEDTGTEGSFRYACMQNGARTIVFDVAGTIYLKSQLKMNRGNVTIAGQTAPGDGICIADYPFQISADNVIIRYVRFRLGNRQVAFHEGDGLGGMDLRNIIVDHCSVSWSVDECLSVYGSKDMTVQWCMATQSLVNAGHSKGAHGYGGNWGGSGASYHHNLIAHNASRTPRLGPRPSTQTDERMDMRNNVIYNWGGEGCYGGEGMNVNIVNNYYKPGSTTAIRSKNRQMRIAGVGIRTTEYTHHGTANVNEWDKMWHVWGKFYVDGNVNTKYPEVTKDNWTYGMYNQIDNAKVDNTFTAATKDTMRLSKPIPFAAVTTHSAEDAYNRVLRYAGCSLHRDALDEAIVKDVADSVCTKTGSGCTPGMINSQDDAGGWPVLKSATAPKDTDGDGMPDKWETANGLNPSDAADGAVVAADGYTNLEHYLNAIVSEITAGQNDGGTMLGDGVETTGGGAAANAEVKGKAVKATWAFNLGEGGQTATLAPEAANAYFKTSYEQHGASLIYKGTGKADNTDFAQTKFQPSQQDGSANADNFIDFVIVPKTGLKFTPTKVTFNSTRWGTGGGNIDYAWFSSDGSTISLEKKVKPERNNVAPYVSTFSSIVSGATASDGPCGLRINLYDLAANKQISFANVVIEGTLSGTVQNVEQKRVKVSVNPADAGKVSIMPKGDSFDVGTEVTLSQTRSFGYKFVGWTDAKGNVLSADDDYKFPLNEDAEITANYTAIPTYALSAGVDGGANDYMVQVSPAANVVDGKNMYEEGAKVTLTASSNPVLAFSNWSNGLTSSEIEVEMTKDVNLTAIYSKTKDYIVGWDFYKEGNSPRTADFASTDNDTRTLAMLNAEGNIASWLDKAHSKGGYEGRDAAVCWVNNAPIGSCYWQTSFSAEAFTDIRVKSAMAYNYNAHKAYNIEYSLDGTSWKKIGTVEMDGAKNWKDTEFALPSDADNKELVYLRWIADMSSAVDGAESSNDGAAISSIYVYGKEKIVNDGIAPKLISTVPTDGAEGVSINGKIVLTFDEKVKVADGAKASINGKELDVAASGKTVVCEYKGLAYSESYAFDLPAAVVSDLAGNAVAEPIDFSFTTRTRPTVAKARYDFIVPTDGSFKDALAMANKRADTSKRFRIFVKKGTYVTPSDETKKVRGGDGVDYPDPKTYLNAPNVSIIGEDIDATVISNNPPAATWDNGYGKACPIEGLRNCDVLQIGSGATRTYMQDITLKNGTADGTGRNCALTDQSDKTICKNVGLYGYQDTYLSNNQNGRFYFEGGKLRGRTDFLCGKGDVYYNNLDLIVCEAGAKIAVPSQGRKYGYVFEGCTIKAEDGKKGIDGNFTLGRPWGKGTPIAVYLNTIMEAQPSIAGWDEMSGGYPALFAEYNSMNKNGSKIDLKGRKGSYDAYDSRNGNNYKNRRVETSVTVLTDEEAARYTLANVMGDGDGWDPSADTEQASAPQHVLLNGNTLSWTNSDYVLCWAVCKDGNVVGFTTEPVYTVDNARASWSVRAANEMGGLGEATIATPTSASGINTIAADAAVTVVEYYSVSGTRVPATTLGVIVRIAYHADGTKSVSKVINK